MSKNIEMNILGDDGQYETLYPYTIPEQVQDLLNNDTKEYIGLTTSATPDDAFRSLYLMNVLGDKCSFTIKFVTATTQTPLEGLPVTCSSYIDSKGNPVSGPLYTNSQGEISTFFKGGSVKLSISGFIDLQNWSQTYQVSNGEQYNYTVKLTTVNFKKWTSTINNIKFSNNVNQMDVTVVGGGGGGGKGQEVSGQLGGGGGGGGGYCTIQEKVSFSINNNYQVVIGAGGNGGNGGNSSFLGVAASGGVLGGDALVYTASGETLHQGYGGKGNGKGGNGSWKTGQYGSYVAPVKAIDGSVYGYSSFTETVLYGGGGAGGNCGRSNEQSYIDAGYFNGGNGYGGDNNTLGNYNDGGNGVNGYGGGGGGANIWSDWDGRDNVASPGIGGSGCVAIRMHLNAT